MSTEESVVNKAEKIPSKSLHFISFASIDVVQLYIYTYMYM